MVTAHVFGPPQVFARLGAGRAFRTWAEAAHGGAAAEGQLQRAVRLWSRLAIATAFGAWRRAHAGGTWQAQAHGTLEALRLARHMSAWAATAARLATRAALSSRA